MHVVISVVVTFQVTEFLFVCSEFSKLFAKASEDLIHWQGQV